MAREEGSYSYNSFVFRYLNSLLHYVYFFASFFFFSGPHLQHMDFPRLGVESEPQLLAYTTAIATAIWNPNRVFDLHHSSWRCWIRNPLIEASIQTHVLMDSSQACLH